MDLLLTAYILSFWVRLLDCRPATPRGSDQPSNETTKEER